MSHDIRVYRPGATATCTQCGGTVKDRWLEIPHVDGHLVETKMWCRGCLLEHVGCPKEAARCRKEDAACAACGGAGGVWVEADMPGNPKEFRPCPDCGACPNCGGTGRTSSCANCEQPSALVSYGGCDHFCWPCGGTGEA